MKFLIVDDSSRMRRIIKNSLERSGFEDILEAARGREALENVVNNYIVRPFTPETLKEKVEAVLK